MKEIEIKAHLKDKNKLIKILNDFGCILSEPINQIDTVYTKIIGRLEDYLKNDHFVRIRQKSDGKTIFTVKKPLSKMVLTKAEHESEIKNHKEFENALFLMGYQIANKVIKNRQTTHYKEFEICIDEVDGLGTFIEIEKMSDKDVDLVRVELNDVLQLLGISKDDEIYKGYDILMIEQL